MALMPISSTTNVVIATLLYVPKNVKLDDVKEMPLRAFAEHPTKFYEFMHSPVGAALLEWNSRLGVPRDVWAVISTAMVKCIFCRLCRSFEGDRAHLDDNGMCTDRGNGGASLVRGSSD
ncbi:hypothetical protein H0H92_001466, partial [Tricholoma furcatifolium]